MLVKNALTRSTFIFGVVFARARFIEAMIGAESIVTLFPLITLSLCIRAVKLSKKSLKNEAPISVRNVLSLECEGDLSNFNAFNQLGRSLSSRSICL